MTDHSVRPPSKDGESALRRTLSESSSTVRAGMREAYSALFEPEESDAFDNLEGALIDIERLSEHGKPTDAVCIRTIKRVLDQLNAAYVVLSAALQLPEAGEPETITSEQMDAIEAAAIAGKPLTSLPSEANSPAAPGDIRERLAQLQAAGCETLTIEQVVGLIGFCEWEAAPVDAGVREAYKRGFDDGQISQERTITDLREQIAELESALSSQPVVRMDQK